MTAELGDRLSVVDECRHHAIGIELEVGGVELVALQLEHVLLGLQTFFCQSQTNLLGTHRVGIVVKLEQLFLPRLRPPGDTSVDYLSASAHAAKRARSCGFLKSTGVPFGMMPVGLTRVIE